MFLSEEATFSQQGLYIYSPAGPNPEQVHVYKFRYVRIVENCPICGYIHSKGIPAEKNNTEHYIQRMHQEILHWKQPAPSSQKDTIGKQILSDFVWLGLPTLVSYR